MSGPTLDLRVLLLMIACGLFALAGQAQQTTGLADQRPNIILVITDDQGYGDVACHGHPYLKTPNLDTLYTQSLRLTDFHVSPTCAPTRSALMSGRLPFKNGVTHTILERERMALSSVTIAQQLKEAGYTTGIFGKWHLGDEEPYLPNRRGFDEMFIHGAGGIGQSYPGSCADVPGNSYFDPVIRHNDTYVKTKGFCTDVFFRQALGWIKQSKDKGRPFFAYITTNAPHAPYICPDQYKDYYQQHTDNKSRVGFFGMIQNIDDNMGLLMSKLTEWELSENTLLIFMSDNGSAAGDFNAGLKGRKGTVNEGGTKVPGFWRWPGKLEAGRDVDTLTRHVDLYPTFLAIAGAKSPVEYELEGRSLLPLLQGDKAPWPDRYTFFHAGRWAKAGAPGNWSKGDADPQASKYKNFAVRSERWRLVGTDQLYDIDADPGESTNVIEQHPDVAAKMLAAYDTWWTQVTPMLVNENAPLLDHHPVVEGYNKQKAESGIPDWQPPEL